jgi:hypothetical protein
VRILQRVRGSKGRGPEECNNFTTDIKPAEGNNGILQMQFVVRRPTCKCTLFQQERRKNIVKK